LNGGMAEEKVPLVMLPGFFTVRRNCKEDNTLLFRT
jgi:hypothetical protein